jgi:hypothetical protein
MFSRMRKRITYTNIALTLVLLFAMTGGAYAAKRYVITSTSQISPKVLRALEGKSGATGSAGAPGAAGAKGETGAKGEPGANGGAGTAGVAGLQGKEGAEGPEGSEGPQGPKGQQGEPWTAGGVLPKGSSEKGVWAADGPPSPGLAGIVDASVSFGIPLKAAPTAHVIEPGEMPPAGCKGSVTEPEAESGNLCVFVAEHIHILAIGTTSPQGGEAGTVGALVEVLPSGTEDVDANGTWAVTG